LGQYYVGVGRLPEAENCYLKTLDLKPTETSIFTALIYLCSLLGEREKAIAYYQKGIETQPNNTSIYSVMGHIRVNWGELNQAMKLADKTQKIDPGDPQGLFVKMRIFLIQSNPDSVFFYLQRVRRVNPQADVFLLSALLAEMKRDGKQARIYADSCISYQMSILKEVKGTPREYGARLEMAGAWLVKGEEKKAREQVEIVTKALGDSLFALLWAQPPRGLLLPLSYCYTRLGENQKAVECLEFLVSKNIVTPAYIRIDPFYKDLAGYPPFEELIKKDN
jgi:tetratricopeptide (TPR) repeat protein